MRYFLFGGGCYYSRGGGHDFVKSFGNLSNAVEYAEALGGTRANQKDPATEYEWLHIFDAETCKIVWRTTPQAHGAE